MTTASVKNEINRFLKSTNAEVLCVRGKWGVGKTFAWRQFLIQAAKDDAIGLDHYSYVSLFGLNSLNDVRRTILENLVNHEQISDGPNLKSYADMVNATGLLARFAPILTAIAGKKDPGEALAQALFLSIRKKIICIDDLERAGTGLELRDVLGLASMLKVERDCKVVFLLNDEQFEDTKKAEFNRLLEKVVDQSLVFNPTPADATDIAFQVKSPTSDFLRAKIVDLGITNIRIIKKIERFSNRLQEILVGKRAEVVAQAMVTVTVGAWAVLDAEIAPSMSYLKGYNRAYPTLALAAEIKKGDEKWGQVLREVGFRYSSELDLLILEGVERGYFDEDSLKSAAAAVEEAILNNKHDNSFTQTWDKYHNSLAVDDDEILDQFFVETQKNYPLISIMNFNSVVKLLRENKRGDQADKLVADYMLSRQFVLSELEEEQRLFGHEPLDVGLQTAFQKIAESDIDNRNPADVLIKISNERGWNPKDIDLLAKQTPEEFERIFETIIGPDLSKSAKFVLSLSLHEGDNYKTMGHAVRGGLRRIAAKSPLRARRVQSYGVELEVEEVGLEKPSEVAA